MGQGGITTQWHRVAGIALAAAALQAAPEYSAGGGEGTSEDAFDVRQGARVIASTPQHNSCCGSSDPRAILGGRFDGTWVEPTRAIFQDGSPAGTVDRVEWQLPAAVDVRTITLHLEQDGPADDRRAARSWRLWGSSDGLSFRTITGGPIPGAPGPNRHTPLRVTDAALTGVTNDLRAFRLEVTRTTTDGVRVIEVDAEAVPGQAATGWFLDRLAFNAVSNRLTGRGSAAEDDEGPGGARGFRVSGSAGGGDTVEDAFGNADGAIEPSTFLFADGGKADNGNTVMGDDGETVDFIEWQVDDALPLAGYRIQLSGDEGGRNRSTEWVRLLVDGEEADRFDNHGFHGAVLRLFADGVRWGGSFRLEFTRSTSSGPRVIEVDALTGPPPPSEGDLVLNEMVSSNGNTLEDEDGDSSDWIELYNGRATEVWLEGWGLSDDPRRPFRWTFPAVGIPPHSHRIVFASGKDRRHPAAPLHTDFQIQAAGEPLLLTQPSGRRQDTMDPVRLREDVSVGRHPNGSGPWRFFEQPSPHRSNTPQAPFDSIVFQAPEWSHTSGFHPTPFTATLTSTEPDVTLRISRNGSEPTEESPEYPGPIAVQDLSGQPAPLSQIRGTATANQHTDGWKPPQGPVRQATVLRARATRPGAIPGPVSTRTFFVGSAAVRTDGLPVVSIAADPLDLFDPDRGIYMLGAVFDAYVAAHPGEALTGHTPANYTQRGPAWERTAHLEWFEPDGTRGFSEPVVVDIQGQSSRSFRQKSFGVKARGPEGARNTIEYPVFPGLTRLGDDSPLDTFRNLRLRNMGNDWDHALMRDDWSHRLVRGLGLDRMASRYLSVYLSGEYWGILAAREQQNPRYVQAHYGLDPEEVVVLHGSGALEEGRPGDGQSWQELLAYCEANPLSDPARFAHVTQRVDADNALHYFISEIYFGNADWPQNNVRVWRRRMEAPEPALGPGRDGRWRWFLFDVDLGVAHPWSAGVDDDTLGAALSPTGRPGFNSPWGTAVLRALLTHPEWRRDFINTAAGLMNSWFSPSHAVALADTMRDELRPAMDEHIRRWRSNGGTVAAWETQVRPVRNFATLRAGRLRTQFLRHFGLPGTARVTVNVSPAGAGTVRIHRLRLGEDLPGAGSPVFPWTGLYFRNVPVPLEALPAPGWRFAGWSGLESPGAEATWIPTGPATLEARFEPDGPVLQEPRWEGATVHLSLQGTPSAVYRIERSADLNAWNDGPTVQCDASGRARAELPSEGGRGTQFVRAVIP